MRVGREKVYAEEVESNLFVTQYPIVQANAITVHKSQGLTLGKVVIHSGYFEEGHLYTALSRITSFEGLVIAEFLEDNDLKTSEAVMVLKEKLDEKIIIEESRMHDTSPDEVRSMPREIADDAELEI